MQDAKNSSSEVESRYDLSLVSAELTLIIFLVIHMLRLAKACGHVIDAGAQARWCGSENYAL